MHDHYDEIKPSAIEKRETDTLILKGYLTNEAKSLILSGDYTRVVFSYGKWEDLNFFSTEQVHLKYILIRSLYVDWDSISEISGLETLILEGKYRQKIDFSKLINLRELHIHWEPKYSKEILKLRHLRSLTLYGYNGEDLREFNQLESLEKLELVRGNVVDFSGIENIKSLKHLELSYMSKLKSIDGLEKLNNLTRLVIESCNNIEFPEFIEGLDAVKEISVCRLKTFKSLDIFKKIKTLECLDVLEMKVEDGNIEILKDFNSLKTIRMDQKRHYNMDVNAFKKELNDKYGDFD